MEDSDRTQRMIAFEKEFAALAQKYTPEFQEAIKRSLGDVEKAVYELGMKRYGNQTGRWYDSFGIPDSVLDFNLILERENISLEDRLLAFAILIYHDSGCPKIDDSSRYADKDIRDLHMRVGALNFASDLGNLVIQDSDGSRRYLFTRPRVSSGFQAVLHHDDKYLGKIENIPDILQIFIDGDNVFVPSFLSSYKDYVSRYGRPVSDKNGKDMSGEVFLRMRQSYFFVPGEDQKLGQEILITEDSNRLYAQKLFPVRFDFTKRVIAAHMLARTEEMRGRVFDYAYLGDWKSFEPHAVDYFEGSIEAAKQGKSFDVLRFGSRVEI